MDLREKAEAIPIDWMLKWNEAKGDDWITSCWLIPEMIKDWAKENEIPGMIENWGKGNE